MWNVYIVVLVSDLALQRFVSDCELACLGFSLIIKFPVSLADVSTYGFQKHRKAPFLHRRGGVESRKRYIVAELNAIYFVSSYSYSLSIHLKLRP